MKISSFASLPLCLCLLLGGCFSLPQNYDQLKEPKVTLTGLALKDANLLAPSFLLRLRVENPNDLELDVDGGDAILSINGQAVAQGTSRGPLKLAKMGSSEMEVEATANTLNVLGQVLQAQENLDYRIDGHIVVLNWLGALGRLPFGAHGTVSRETLLKTLDQGLPADAAIGWPSPN